MNVATIKPNIAAVVDQGPRDAVDHGGLARAVGPNQAQAFTALHMQVDRIEGREAAKVLADVVYFEDCFHFFTSPSTPSGAATTKNTSSNPTTSTLSSFDTVTVTICCKVPKSRAPITGPIQ